jgi:hypothetical protein
MTEPREFDAVLSTGCLTPVTAAVLGMTSRYSHPQYKQFCLDAAKAGLRVQHARMRFYWEGPVIYTSDLQDVLSCTQVKCLWDEDGTRFVVYPRAYTDKALIEAIENFEDDKAALALSLRMPQPHKALAENFLNHIQKFNPRLI